MRACVVVVALTISRRGAARQVFTNKEVGQKNAALVDSLKHSEYPYALPIWGAKATQRGYSLPYSAGLSLQYFGQRSDISHRQPDGGLQPRARCTTSTASFASTTVKSASDGVLAAARHLAVPVPQRLRDPRPAPPLRRRSTTASGCRTLSGGEQEVFSLGTKVDFTANTFGFGLTPTMGVGGGWLALDMNFTWTDVPQLAQPASAFVFDPRMGKSFRLGRPDENINFWVGGFRLKLNTGTSGSIPLGDALPIAEWQSKVNTGLERVAGAGCRGRGVVERTVAAAAGQPANRARYEAAKAALARAGAFLSSANTAVGNAGSATVSTRSTSVPRTCGTSSSAPSTSSTSRGWRASRWAS